MKIKLFVSCAAALMLSSTVAPSQNLIWNPWDFDVEGWASGWGVEGISVSHDPSKDANNNPNSGAFLWEVPWSAGGESVLQRNNGISDLTGYSALGIDVYVEPGTTPSPNGDYGSLTLRFRPNWEWPGVVFSLGPITNTGWIHRELPIPSNATGFAGMNIHWNSSYTSTARIWLDNLTLIAPSLVYASFDTNAQGFPCNDWGVIHTDTFDPGLDANSSPTSGSLAVDAEFTTGGEVVLQRCVGAEDLTEYGLAAIDVYVDPSTVPGTNGTFGTFTLRLRPGDYEWPGVVIELGAVTNTGWTQLRGTLPPNATSFTAINLHWNTTFINTTKIWIDNIRFLWAPEPPPPPTILSFENSRAGLEVVTASTGDYARKNIATSANLATTASWMASTQPVTYSMTVNEDTSQGSPYLSANIMLIGTEALSIGGAPDWTEPNAIVMEAVQSEVGTLNVQVRYKANAANGHGIRFEPAGLLIQTNTTLTSLVGTWSLTLQGTSVSLTAPGGVTGAGELPADVPALFSQSFFALFGLQPNGRTYRRIALSRVQVSGSGDFQGTVDVDFTKAVEIDPNVLEAKEEEPGGVHLRPTNTIYRLSWGLPDTGFSLVGSELTAPVSWSPVQAITVNERSQRAAFVTDSKTVKPQFFFRLRQ